MAEKNKRKMKREYIPDFDQLHESMRKCQKGVTWKSSFKSLVLNSEERLHGMEKQLKNGTWKNGRPKEINIMYPKKRKGLSVSFKDRIYQRSINDNALYPDMTKHFVYANVACQKGKGTDFTRALIKRYLRNYFCKYGREGYVLQMDIHGYYEHMQHEEVKRCFAKGTDAESFQMSMDVLDTQYSGTVGYNPGSQMVQIAGISVLNDVDHLIKEKLHAAYYIRYMDDLWILWNDLKELKSWYAAIEHELNRKGFELNATKSHVTPLRKGFLFLGFHYRMTDTGKIIMTLNSENVRHERKKLVRMVNKEKKGELTKEKTNECFHSWRNNAGKGNSNKLVSRTEKYIKTLRKGGEPNEIQETHTDTGRLCRQRKYGGKGREAGGND